MPKAQPPKLPYHRDEDAVRLRRHVNAYDKPLYVTGRHLAMLAGVHSEYVYRYVNSARLDPDAWIDQHTEHDERMLPLFLVDDLDTHIAEVKRLREKFCQRKSPSGTSGP